MSSRDVTPQTLPWRQSHPNRLGCALAAVQSFVEKRGNQSPDDVVSLMAFNNAVSERTHSHADPAIQQWHSMASKFEN